MKLFVPVHFADVVPAGWIHKTMSDQSHASRRVAGSLHADIILHVMPWAGIDSASLTILMYAKECNESKTAQ